MRRLRSCVVVVGALVALWAGVGVALGAVAPDTRNAPSESDFVARVNQARGAAGLGALAVRDDLVAVARQHSTDMANQHRLYHNPSLASSVTGWQRVGENVGTGGDVPSIEDAFMHSQVHRDDILSPYFTEIGVGVVWDGSTLWVTQVFRQPSSAAAAAPAPAPAPTPAPVRRPQAVAPRPAPVARPTTAAPVTVPPTSVVAHPPTESRSTAVSGGENASVLEDARAADAPVPAPAVLGELREQAIAVPASVPRMPVPVGVAAGLLALVTALEGAVVRRLGLA